MANTNPPKRAQAFDVAIALQDSSDSRLHKINPTIAAGDFKIEKDFGAAANPTALPAVAPAEALKIWRYWSTPAGLYTWYP